VLPFTFFVLSAISLLLQIYNIVRLNLFWPFFLGIKVQLLAAMFQFMLMILRPSGADGSRPNSF